MKQAGRMTWARPLAFALAATFLLGGSALAVTDEEIFRDFRWNLANPGARSLGLGGAFIAVADDATAALANPAGLTLLQRPEFFTEIRDRTADTTVIEDPTVNPFGDDSLVISETDPQAVFSPSFLAWVYPFEKWALGFSRIEINNTNNITSSNYVLDFTSTGPGVDRELTSEGRIDSDVSLWNASAAVKLGEHVSVGATVAVGIANINSRVDNAIIDRLGGFSQRYTPMVMYTTAIDDQDTDVAFNAGIHWQAHPRVSFGAVYRGGHEFEVDQFLDNEAFFSNVYGLPNSTNLSDFLGNPFTTTFNTPDTYGVGASWRPTNRLTFSLDVTQVEYEDLLEGYVSGLNALTVTVFDNTQGFVPVVSSEDLQDVVAFTVEDATEVHFGVEYVLSIGTIPWALRAGFFTEHNNRIFEDFDPSVEDPTSGNALFFSTPDSFPEGDDTTHYTVGTGVVVKERFQIDAAASFSDITNEYVLSTIFRF